MSEDDPGMKTIRLASRALATIGACWVLAHQVSGAGVGAFPFFDAVAMAAIAVYWLYYRQPRP